MPASASRRIRISTRYCVNMKPSFPRCLSSRRSRSKTAVDLRFRWMLNGLWERNANAVGNTRRELARTKPSRRFARDAARPFGRSLGAERVAGRGRERPRRADFGGCRARAVLEIRARNWWRQNLRDALFGVRRGAPGDARVLSMSQVAVENERQRVADSVDAERAAGEKCERCWKYTPGLTGANFERSSGAVTRRD